MYQTWNPNRLLSIYLCKFQEKFNDTEGVIRNNNVMAKRKKTI